MQKLPTILIERANSHFADFIAKLDIALAKDEREAKKHARYLQLLDKHKEQVMLAFALSDFIARTAQQYPIQFMHKLPAIIEHPEHDGQQYQEYYLQLQQHLQQTLATEDNEATLHAGLRQFRHLIMLSIAWRDLVYNADIKQSLLAISHLADALINCANAWLYQNACKRYGKPKPVSQSVDDSAPTLQQQQLLVIGMGKLGGHELNFSSDIDLIFVYPGSGETDHPRKPLDHQTFFTRLAQKLVAALHQTTMDGQVYRVDMRLRPLGDSGPLVVSMGAFESYYLEQGREWERFAMQKARVINPDSEAVRELQSIITPFVYRKYLDFTTIESLRNMKQLIENEVARRNLTNNIKLGKGGIREVEFFVQSLQMIHAGRVPECQTKSILASFKALVEHDFLPEKDATELQNSYLFLRQVEHYLQAFDDKQTQQLPDSDLDRARLWFLLATMPEHDTPLSNKSDPDTDLKIDLIQQHMQRINGHFRSLIEESPEEKDDSQALNQSFNDLWLLDLATSEIQSVLLPVVGDTTESEKLSAQLVEFKRKCTKHDIGQRGHNTLNKLIPQLLNEVLNYQDSADTDIIHSASDLFERIFDILLTIVGRTTYLDLLLENPAVRRRLITLSANSQWVARQIKAFPLLLDELLHPAYLQPDQADITTWRSEYENELRLQLLRVEPDDVEAQMDALRYFKLTQQLRIAAADITGTLAINNVSDKLTVLAEVLLAQVIDIAWIQMASRYGTPRGYSMQNKGLGVLAYGKMGGIELGYGSDLDIVFVHDVNLTTMTDGQKQVSCSEFFVKLVQRVTHIFTTKTYLNILYEIDLRLRPSGNSGLLISHIDTFSQYQENSAWTWEHQALVRARYVYGHAALEHKFADIRTSILEKKREIGTLRKEVADMREKMRQHLDKSNSQNADLKQTSGGITDLEFLTQYWVLLHSHTHSELTKWSDNLRILDSLAQADIISTSQNKALQEAYLFIRNQLHKLSLGAFGRHTAVPGLENHMTIIQRNYARVFKD
ncbi:bifunctional [glutamate--ammonia ligase]-adenylyl-L-tyrosine phosphorylase/[glutamate--ammonia-ligase] adenylyltransferase [Glaciecola sp. 33A]|uniref:bifunctional [glutamate--ammonia ligase]-adenylyl-L-tyrosine phosphorylase/[glutamate--ammonia-ligase] adenylyltransferase n=1 Tax=Glaciecola sp. 33A TaxID=2057807 RepID=UPI000C32A8AE|nr:bifunctional [glutamate--ammonia ligase]-adenylyl-L-tyrosine phosphorylase/[glutamate--ammonia-ligase] adenylyltransferase [Glaciecola sp. 33A]PKI02391.1 bifunctional [glutamate--ammonia ligase]-adenylyl-L-tyrosine phosphorylase/[glutamate--ammonia-ligase] adenylyltransferase [Glaciecola sp. 33A]